MIEQWLPNATLDKCKSAHRGSDDEEWWTTRILPFTDMTIKGWTWYQVSMRRNLSSAGMRRTSSPRMNGRGGHDTWPPLLSSNTMRHTLGERKMLTVWDERCD